MLFLNRYKTKALAGWECNLKHCWWKIATKAFEIQAYL
jgi:hypothetical protein